MPVAIFRCILALKRADNDLKKTSLFLKQHVQGGHTSAISNEDTCETVNGVSPQPVPEGKLCFKPGFSHLDQRPPLQVNYVKRFSFEFLN
jgi:hypothetical protein